jgi:hypothetical protein
MGTNYYIKQKPLVNDVNRLVSLIEDTLDNQDVNYQEIKDLVDELYDERTPFNLNGRVIHIGKNSIGWKFLWNPNIIEIPNYNYTDNGKKITVTSSTYDKVYELTKESIREFIMRPENILVDEYGDIQDKEEFLDWAFNKDGLDSESYAEKYKDESRHSEYPETERQKMWKDLGFTFNSIYQHDFYSDGLRFSTSVEFS